MQQIVGIRNTGEIPRAKVLNDDGTIVERQPQRFNTRVAPTQAEYEAQRSEEKYRQKQASHPVVIETKWLDKVNRSDDPEVAAEQERLFNVVHSLEFEIEAFNYKMVAAELARLKGAHKELVKLARAALDETKSFANPIATAQNHLREYGFQLNRENVRLTAIRGTKLSRYANDEEVEEQASLLKFQEQVVKEKQEHLNELQQELSSLAIRQADSHEKFRLADAAVKASEARINQLEGKPATEGKRSSISYSESGLIG